MNANAARECWRWYTCLNSDGHITPRLPCALHSRPDRRRRFSVNGEQPGRRFPDSLRRVRPGGRWPAFPRRRKPVQVGWSPAMNIGRRRLLRTALDRGCHAQPVGVLRARIRRERKSNTWRSYRIARLVEARVPSYRSTAIAAVNGADSQKPFSWAGRTATFWSWSERPSEHCGCAISQRGAGQ
jgi:hypothetical protein